MIESVVKERLSYIIEYEKGVAITAELCGSATDFIEIISNNLEWQEYFYEEYPFIAEYLTNSYLKIRLLIENVILCLDTDFSEIELPVKSVLNDISIGQGDFHNGRCTCKLTFNDEDVVFYKPRSLEIDIEISNFLSSFEKIINKKYFYPVLNINKGSYGWSKAVKIVSCKSEDGIKNYYEGMGVFTALAHALKIEDIIFDNIISTNGLIALIDLECSFCTEIPINKNVFYRLNSQAGDFYRNSVINTGIIPRHTYGGLNSDGESDGALSYFSFKSANERNKTAANTNFKLTKKSVNHQSNAPHNIPVLNTTPCSIKNYVKNYIDGFKEGYFAIVNNKDIFEEFIKKLELKKTETRIIYRATKIYATILNESFHTEYLQSKESRENLFISMFNAEHTGTPNKIIRSEIEQLQNGDIPAFKKKIGINQVFTFSGQSLGITYADETDALQVRKRVSELGLDDYKQQVKAITQSLKIFEKIDYVEQAPRFMEKKFPSSFQEPVIENFVHNLVDFIYKQLLIDDNSVSFLDTFINANNGWEFGPIGPGLAHGTDGIAILFFRYGNLFKKEQFIELSEKIIKSNRTLFFNYFKEDTNYDNVPHFAFSPFNFPVSILYASNIIGTQSKNYHGYNELDDHIYHYFMKWINKDQLLDMLNGSCGAIFLFYQLYKSTKGERYKELVELCANYLSQKATNINQEMVCWSSDKFSNLGGFSHGTASYSVAMLLAYDLLKDSRYFNLFEKSLNHDRSLFSSEHNMYKDNRYYPKIQFSNSWAHGSGGIGLSRLLLADFLPEYSGLNREIEICRNNLNKGLEFQSDYAVSGGFSGNIEVLRALNNFCGADNTYLHDIILGKIKQYKSNPVYFATANHHIHLLMNTGIAGFAYTLMRYLAPETTPSILNLSINTNFGSKCLYAK